MDWSQKYCLHRNKQAFSVADNKKIRFKSGLKGPLTVLSSTRATKSAYSKAKTIVMLPELTF